MMMGSRVDEPVMADVAQPLPKRALFDGVFAEPKTPALAFALARPEATPSQSLLACLVPGGMVTVNGRLATVVKAPMSPSSTVTVRLPEGDAIQVPLSQIGMPDGKLLPVRSLASPLSSLPPGMHAWANSTGFSLAATPPRLNLPAPVHVTVQDADADAGGENGGEGTNKDTSNTDEDTPAGKEKHAIQQGLGTDHAASGAVPSPFRGTGLLLSDFSPFKGMSPLFPSAAISASDADVSSNPMQTGAGFFLNEQLNYSDDAHLTLPSPVLFSFELLVQPPQLSMQADSDNKNPPSRHQVTMPSGPLPPRKEVLQNLAKFPLVAVGEAFELTFTPVVSPEAYITGYPPPPFGQVATGRVAEFKAGSYPDAVVPEFSEVVLGFEIFFYNRVTGEPHCLRCQNVLPDCACSYASDLLEVCCNCKGLPPTVREAGENNEVCFVVYGCLTYFN